MQRNKTTARKLSLCWILTAVMSLTACTQQKPFVADIPDIAPKIDTGVKQTSYEEISPVDSLTSVLPPFDLDTEAANVPYWDLGLQDAIQYALANSTVMREIGANLLRTPDNARTIYEPSIMATDVRFGEEAALSAFDAQWATNLFYIRGDRALNNTLLGGGTNFFEQDLMRFQTELSKQTAAGTRLAVRHNFDDDYNNAPANIYGREGDINAHAWTWNWEAEVRQPILRGAGVEYNRIAGPYAVPGDLRGVLIARVSTSISAADFQIALRNYLSNVENAYWELVFAYRDLDAKKAARDRALSTWRRLKELRDQDIAGAEEDKLAQAEEQYFRFQQDVENALGGRLVNGTQAYNGTTGGTFEGSGGVYVAERRLRLIMGAPISDGRLIRPTTEPSTAEVIFDWDQLASSALARRTELLQQRLRIQRRRLELTANRNFLLPQFDLVGRYTVPALGDHLYDPKVPPGIAGGPDSTTNEWQLGVEMSVPLGYRLGNSAVRNSELALARERAIHGELERQIVHDVSNAVAEQARLHKVLQTAYNRRSAALRQFTVLHDPDVQASARRIDYNLLLDSERRLADAEIAYYRATVEYAVAIKNVNLEVENLLPYCNVQIAGAALE